MAAKEEKKPVTDAVLKKLLPKGFKLEKPIGTRADLLKAVIVKESEVKKIQLKELTPLTDFKKAMQEWFVENLAYNDGAVGENYMAKIEKSHYIIVEDWDALREFIWKKKQFQILMKSVQDAAIFELLEAGVKVPGIKVADYKKLSLTKAGKKKTKV